MPVGARRMKSTQWFLEFDVAASLSHTSCYHLSHEQKRTVISQRAELTWLFSVVSRRFISGTHELLSVIPKAQGDDHSSETDMICADKVVPALQHEPTSRPLRLLPALPSLLGCGRSSARDAERGRHSRFHFSTMIHLCNHGATITCKFTTGLWEGGISHSLIAHP